MKKPLKKSKIITLIHNCIDYVTILIFRKFQENKKDRQTKRPAKDTQTDKHRDRERQTQNLVGN